METQYQTERQKQYYEAPRPEKDPFMPTVGYYFIRTIKNGYRDPNGNIAPYAIVNWKCNEEDSWEPIKENNFKINLRYLLSPFDRKPKATYKQLIHQVIHVSKVYINVLDRQAQTADRIICEWEITGFLDMLDALPYFSLVNSQINAMEDDKLEADLVNDMALRCDPGSLDEEPAYEEEAELEPHESDNYDIEPDGDINDDIED